jgi:hypothetical protein
MTTYYDGPEALVDERVLVVRDEPALTFRIGEVGSPYVIKAAVHWVESMLSQVFGCLFLVALAAWPAARRPETFIFGAVVIAGASAAIAAWRRLRARAFELRATYQGMEIVLLSSGRQANLSRIAQALAGAEKAHLQKLGQNFGDGHSRDRAA